MKKTMIRKKYNGNQKIKFAGLYGTAIFTSVLLLLASCVKDELHNTPHPDMGAVRVTTDWSGRSSDAVLPDSYILRMDDKEQTVSGETNAVNALFLPGGQDLLVYHQTEGISISGDIATVNTLADGTLEPMPGYLFSGTKELEIVKDDTLRVTVPMQQHIRNLTLALKLNPGDKERIGSTTATLTGIVNAVNLTTGATASPVGNTIAPTFAIGTNEQARMRSAGEPALVATLRLLGVMTGERQVLTLAVTLTDGTVQTIITDLTEMLKDFGSGTDMEPLTLDATLELPKEAGMNGTIHNWNIVENGNINVN